ncbi:hypothetical protein BHM03_00029187 [Ensete ventricosum]|nr:hypothetical protein BHM03_00029187 [Ensete ventricosum]
MRLNHVEPFYAFLLHFYSEHSKERGSALAKPFARAISHGQALYKGDRKQLGSPAASTHGAAPTRGQAVGVALARGLPTRGGACQRPGRRGSARGQPIEWRRPQGQCPWLAHRGATPAHQQGAARG